jgi:putative sterol carrier protein
MCDLTAGPADKPDLTLEMSSGDFLDIVSGKAAGPALVMAGKVKIKGDIFLAMKVRSMFNRE